MTNVTALKIEPDSSQLEIIKAEIDSVPDDKLLESVPQLVETLGSSAFALGGYLARIKAKKLWPYEDMPLSKWMESQGIKKSRGYQLAQAYEAIVKCHLPSNILDRIGWSKLCLIATLLKPGKSKVATEKNAFWISHAEMCNQSKLRDDVNCAKSQSGKAGTYTPSETVQHVFKLHDAQEQKYQAAMTRSKNEIDTDKDVEAMDAILTGYLDGTTKTVTLKSMMKKSGSAEVLMMFAEIWPNIDVTAKL